MAEDLDDGEFWLPSKFLSDTDDDTVADFDASTPSTNSTNGFNSDLGSPLDSVTETESDEDEFLAELTHQMARHSLLLGSSAPPPKVWVSSGSPQSTLSPVGGFQTHGGGSNPTGPVSPPSAPAKGAGDTASFDLLHAAAAEVVKMRLRIEQPQKGTGYFDSNRGLLCSPRKHTNHNFHGFCSHQSGLSLQQLQASQFQELWGQEMMMKHESAKGSGGGWSQPKPSVQVISRTNAGEEYFRGGSGSGRSNIQTPNRHLGLSPAAWPPLQHPHQQQNRHIPPPLAPVVSGMRAVFLGTPGSKRESTGTGVFLPRRVTPTEPPGRDNSKSGCSTTVLVPEKVVQALNNINAHPRCQPRQDSNGRFRGHNNGVHAPRHKSENAISESGASHPEIQLLSEWAY